MINIDLERFKSEMERGGMVIRKKTPHLKCDNAKELFDFFFKQTVPNYEWIPEYDKVVEWLTDNKGRSLLMTGNVGRGKTVIGMDVVPKVFFYEHNRVISYYKSIELNTKTEEVMNRFLVSIDDVGFEGYRNDYGQKRLVFLDLLNRMEQDGSLTIATTNLTSQQMFDLYGERAMDRIKALFKIVRFEGKSFRK